MVSNAPTDEPPTAPAGNSAPRKGKPRSPDAERRRQRILRSTAALPALCTLLNGVSGFASISFAVDLLGRPQPSNLMMASWLIFLAMIFDMLDGRLARMTRRTSDFGAQLDSLCDAVSFGIAPAVLMVKAVVPLMQGQDLSGLLQGSAIPERSVWCIGAIFLSCAIMRLARFNVENEPDESAHMNFKGLPSPGAAAAIAGLILLFGYLRGDSSIPGPVLSVAAVIVLPLVTLAAALLMVSRIRYPHIVNQYIRGKRPLNHIIKVLLIVIAACLVPYWTIAVATVVYAFSGPIGAIWRMRSSNRESRIANSP